MPVFEQDNMLIFDRSTDVLNNLSDRDAVLASISGTASWTYNIKDKSMIFEYEYEGDNQANRKVKFENYRQIFLDMNLIFPEDENLFISFCEDLEVGRPSIFVEYRALGENYKQVWTRQVGQTLFNELGDPVKVKGREVDISRERINKNEKIVQDSLTGLYHRDTIKDLIIEAHSANKANSGAYIIIDLDRFHDINEKYGKMRGDLILQSVAGLINTNFMSKDYVGRIAGDEFIVFCNDIETTKVKELVDNLRKRIETNISLDEGSLTFSVGVSFFPRHGSDFRELYAKADIALAAAKKSGDGGYCEYSSDLSDVAIGYSLQKVGKFDEDEVRLNQAVERVNKKLFDYAFDVLSKKDIYIAIKEINEELCLHYKIDRATLMEFDKRDSHPSVTSIWSKSIGEQDLKIMGEVTHDNWMKFEDVAHNSDYICLNSGRGDNLDFFREVVGMNNVPVSSVLFPVLNNSQLACIFAFESYEERTFEKSEIATFKSITKLISSYLLSQQIKLELELDSIINKNVMDTQKLIYYVVDEETYDIKYFSKYAADAFPHAAYGKKCYEAIKGFNSPCQACPIKSVIDSKDTMIYYSEADDSWYSLSASHMKGTKSDKDVIVCITDVTDFIQKVRGEDNLTVADSYSRFVYMATMEYLKHVREYSILCAGIQDFSKINDQYGYVIGDEILKRFAEKIKDDLLDGEMFCRIKGDDFAILAQKNQSVELKDYFKKYSDELTAEFKERFPNIEITCFAGGYDIGDQGEYINHCIDKAMKARNVAFKDRARTGGFYMYTAEFEQKEIQERIMEEKINDALKNDGFLVYFQPKVDVRDESIIGAEALVRMKDSEGNMVSPGLFIPIAESSGLITEIDNTVYEKTFRQMSIWKMQGKKVPLISVNVSRIHLIDDAFPPRMKALSDKYGLNPSEIELEITESVFFEDTERLIDMIKTLKNYGFVISMDDFGSGYSTLNFMKNLPVDVIKIDGGFFMKNEMDVKSRAVISAIMQLSNNLQFSTVLEGVETKEQVEFIKEQDGVCVQGYYYYKPLPFEEFEKLI